jgi:hypothetical protein
VVFLNVELVIIPFCVLDAQASPLELRRELEEYRAMPLVQSRSAGLVVCLLGAGFLHASAACSLLTDPQRRQCSTDGDCSRRGGVFAGSVCIDSVCTQPSPWGCLGSVVWPRPGSGSVTVTLDLVDLISSAPVPDVSARVCRKLDPDCTQPITTDLLSDSAGKLTIPVPDGFDGYVELAPAEAVPGMYFFYPPLTANRDELEVPLLTLASLNYLAQLAGTRLLDDHSQVFLGADNCLGQPASGVRLSSEDSDDSTAPFYLIQKIPSTTATETDSEGRGGILNIRPGSTTITGKVASTGQTVGTLSVFTRQGQVTYTTLVPTPG